MIDALEHRQEIIDALRNQSPSIIVMQANLPGPHKQHPISHLLLRLFSKRVVQRGYAVARVLNEGIPTILFTSLEEGQTTKQAMMEVESTPLGRFIDCDVFDRHQQKPYSRSEQRRCYLCEKSAFVCRKEQNHTSGELLDFMLNEIKHYLTPILEQMIASALKQELDLHPKFGLVTPHTNGSHHDMDYELFMQSIQAITPFLPRFFFLPLEMTSLEAGFHQARMWGKEVESVMFQATNGINTHKGSIFHFSLYLLGLGSTISQPVNQTKRVFDWITEWVKPYPSTTLSSYGALMEAKRGYSSIQGLFTQPLEGTQAQVETLGQLIVRTDDSVLFKRAKTEAEVKRIKHQFETLDWDNPEAIFALNDECIANGYSFGGAADLLSLLHLHQQCQRMFF